MGPSPKMLAAEAEQLALKAEELRNEQHAEMAEDICRELCKKPNCRQCYGRGFVGRNKFNLVVPCRCVDSRELMRRWKAHIAQADAASRKEES